jgi:hypothetical protein
MSSTYERNIIVEIAKQALIEGLRVFISKDGEGDYGFFTDQEGKRVVTFGCSYLVPRFAGCYEPPSRESGTGWVIMDGYPETLSRLLNAYPPERAGRGWKYFTTVDKHLKVYGKTSKYREVTLTDLSD